MILPGSELITHLLSGGPHTAALTLIDAVKPQAQQSAAPLGLSQIGEIIVATGGLGTAAFGLVDAGKALGIINGIGFKKIRVTVTALTPILPAAPGQSSNALSQGRILDTLKANWFNGTDLGSQKAIAKSLIKLYLNANNAASVAGVTGVDPTLLQAVAGKIASGGTLTSNETDVYARFDLIVTAMLDEAYQYADSTYRHGTQCIAMCVAILLAIAGDWILQWHYDPTVHKEILLSSGKELLLAAGIGLLATPLAPIAKDLSTALAAAVNAMQAVKKV